MLKRISDTRARLIKLLFITLLMVMRSQSSQACAPLNTPSLVSQSIVGGTLSLIVSNTSVWLNCPNVIDVEIACFGAPYSGLPASTFTSNPQTFNSSPYTYPTQTINISTLCPGTVYKFRMRERNNNSPTSSSWTGNYTFTTSGVFQQPTLILSANPNVICPPQSNSLLATVANSCGTSGFTYQWMPSTGLNNPNIPNPIATVTAPTVYSVVVTGGATGCWTLTGTLPLNIGSNPPIAGTAAVSPSVVCVGLPVILSLSNYTGNIQWQSGPSSLGPWTNLPNGNTATYITPPLNNSTCFQALVTNCSGLSGSVTTNVVCAATNTVPSLVAYTGCTSTLSQVSFSNFGASGTPSNVVWSPAPITLSNNSTTASYTVTGPVTATASFNDGCVATTSLNLLTPNLVFNSSNISCATLGSATVTPQNMPGPYTYTWNPTSQSNSVALQLYPSIYTISVGYSNGNCVYTATNVFTSPPYSGNIASSPSVSCFGAATGTAAVNPLTGGSGSTWYNWTDGVMTQTTPIATGLTAGLYTVTVIDAITFCSLTQVFLITQPPGQSLTVTAQSPSACAGGSILLNASSSGGGGAPYAYSWNGVPGNNTYTASQNFGGNYIYTVTSTDQNNCALNGTVATSFISNPVISVASISVCPFQQGTLTASGASTYTWNNFSQGNSLTDNPGVTTVYTVTGSSSTCSSSATASIIMKPIPVPQLTSNSPVCNGRSLQFGASGGTSYLWSGPLNYTSALSLNAINPASPPNTGAYGVTVTAANSCTAAGSISLTVNPTPFITTSGSTVCVNQNIQLLANSIPGATFYWTGPQQFSSAQQNPQISNPSVGMSGQYNVTVTSAPGCTNTGAADVTVTPMPTPMFTSNSPRCEGTTLNLFGYGGGSYQWTGPANFSSNQPNPVLTNVSAAAGGLYNLNVTVGPCTALFSQQVTVNPLPSPQPMNTSPACETKSFALIATNPQNISSYIWFGPNAFYASTQSVVVSPAQKTHTGTYTLIVTDQNGCSNSATTAAQVLLNPVLSVSTPTVCRYSKASIIASGADGYEWQGAWLLVSNSATAEIAAANNSGATVYTVTGTAVNGCTSVATASVFTWELPIASLSVSPGNTLCLNETLTLNGEGGVLYEWYGPSEVYFRGQQASLALSSFGYAGTYTLAVTDTSGCRGSVSTEIVINPLPQGNLKGSRMAACTPFCSDFGFYSTASDASRITSTWLLKQKRYEGDFKACFTLPGDYPVIGFFTDTVTGCANSATFVINAYPVPVADFSYLPLQPVENADEVSFTDNSSGEVLKPGTWYFGDNTEKSEGSKVWKLYIESGFYPVALITENKWGCSDTVVKTVKIEEDFNVFVPNVFTPNGDIHNQAFRPVTRGVKLYRLSVFNRWGNLVFESFDPEQGWDGTYKGAPCKSDVYSWKIDISGHHGQQKQLAGHVTLYR